MVTPTTVNIVIPCFNEEERISGDELLQFVSERPWLQFTLVDDGSTDGTRDLLLNLARRSQGRIEALLFEKNHGKAEAVRQGFQHVFKGPHWAVGFWDADLATPLVDIEQFTRQLKENRKLDLVIGSRIKLLGHAISRNPRRHYLGRLAATVASQVLGLKVYDTQCGAKLFRVSPRIKQIFETPFHTKWIFDVEILARWINALHNEEGGDPEEHILEIPLNQWTDIEGSKLTSLDMMQAPIELGRIYWHYRELLKKVE